MIREGFKTLRFQNEGNASVDLITVYIYNKIWAKAFDKLGKECYFAIKEQNRYMSSYIFDCSKR